MTVLDYVVLVAYFVVMIGIGIWSMLAVKKQEDFFLGSRTFGRLFQAFAAFGAGATTLIPIGAVLFYTSDIAVARNQFVAPGVMNRVWGLTLYYLAQVLLAATAGG